MGQPHPRFDRREVDTAMTATCGPWQEDPASTALPPSDPETLLGPINPERSRGQRLGGEAKAPAEGATLAELYQLRTNGKTNHERPLSTGAYL